MLNGAVKCKRTRAKLRQAVAAVVRLPRFFSLLFLKNIFTQERLGCSDVNLRVLAHKIAEPVLDPMSPVSLFCAFHLCHHHRDVRLKVLPFAAPFDRFTGFKLVNIFFEIVAVQRRTGRRCE